MGGLVGSAPKVQQLPPTSTVDPSQQALLNQLSGQLAGSQGVGNALNFGQVQPSLAGTQYAAPLSGLQNTSLQGIENLVNAYTSGPASAQPGVAGGLNTAVQGQERQITTPQVGMIDATQAFNKGVVEPLTQDFTNFTIPAIEGQYGGSAGGAYSSDQQGARQKAGLNLSRTLAQTGSQFALGAAEANQGAQATNAQLAQSAATSLPGLLASGIGIDTAQEGLLGGGLSAGAVPQATQQAQLTGEQQDFQSILQQIQQRIADALGLSTAGTQQAQTVVNPGQTGLLPSLISAFAGGAARSLFQPALGSAGALV